MLFVHEVHALTGASSTAFEAQLRDRWAPALAREDDTRLVWCVRSIPGTISFPEVVTLTALADGAALVRLGERMREGDLRADLAALESGRAGVTRRIVAPLIFSPLAEVDLAAIPVVPELNDAEDAMYIHDFVPPRLGKQRVYETAMRDVYLKMLETGGHQMMAWAGLETVAGGGPVPESVMITRMATPEAGVKTLTTEITPELAAPGSWIWEGLKLRDTWTSRLVRTTSWSPLK